MDLREFEIVVVLLLVQVLLQLPHKLVLHIRRTAAATQRLSAAPSVPLGHFTFWLLSVGSGGGQKLFEPRTPQELPVLVCALVCLVAEMWWAWMGGNNTARRNQESLTHCQVGCVHRSDGDAKRLGLHVWILLSLALAAPVGAAAQRRVDGNAQSGSKTFKSWTRWSVRAVGTISVELARC